MIPPQGSYDLASLISMGRVDMNVISGECVWSATLGEGAVTVAVAVRVRVTVL